MNWLVSTSLKLRVMVLAASIVLVVVGALTLRTAPLDVFPEFAEPLVEIQTEAPGLSTEEVESLITIPLENGLKGTPWLKTLRSKSVLGLSSVVLIFPRGTDLVRARQFVQERLAMEASRLPVIAHAPVMLSPLSSTSRVLKIGVTSKTMTQMEISELAKWTIRPNLMAIQGVANVAIWGQRDRQLQVLVNPEQLRAHSVTLDAVQRAVAESVALSGGGFVDTPNQRIAVRQMTGVDNPEDLGAAIVDYRSGSPILLRDVANIVEGHPLPIGDAVINDGPGLLLIVEKQPWGNTLEVTQKVEAALEELRPGLKGVDIDPTIFRPATFIERSLHNLRHAMGVGCLLVIIILLVFLFDWRTSLISLTAIPLSLISAALALYYTGSTINTMVIAGLVIALGEVVDDAIIDVENILRRLTLNRSLEKPLTPFQVVLQASLEVRSAVVYASLIVTLVFLPVLFLDGISGAFFRPLAIAYILAILASLLVALTVTPALSLMLLPGSTKDHHEAPLAQFLKGIYGKILPFWIKNPVLAIGLIIAMFVSTAFGALRLGQEHLPSFKETDFLMHWVEKPGSSLESMQRITVQVSRELRAIPGVRNFGSHIGRAEVADEVVGPNFTELWISVDPEVNLDKTIVKIEEVINGYPGLKRDVLTYLKERIKEVLSGAGASIVVRVYGTDLTVLRAKAQEVYATMNQVKGVKDLQVESQVLVPQIQVRLRPNAVTRFGLTAGQIRRSVATLIKGTKVGEIYGDQKTTDVVVWGTPELRTDITSLQGILIDVPNGGGQVPLGDLADIQVLPAPNEIKHEKASRRIDITCNVKDRDLGSVAREIEETVKKLDFAQGYHPEFLGEYAALAESRIRLVALGFLSMIGILLLLHVDFRSWKLTAIVFLTLPFALFGGVAGVLLDNRIVSLGSMVGFVTVLGIAARNGIMLVSHYRHLEEQEGEPFGAALVQRGSEERLAPILMTVLATGLALVPLVWGGNLPGHEIEYPMAIVILGGLVTSTILNLFLLPPIYLAFGRVNRQEE
ncbi:MAG: efflux RND transporter permease subunit [Schlesneria sp.]